MQNKIVMAIIGILFIILASLEMVNAGSEMRFAVNRTDMNQYDCMFSPDYYIENGRTMIAVRSVSENLGYQVKWDGIQQVVTVITRDKAVIFGIDSHLVLIQNPDISINKHIEIVPTIKNGRTYLPLRILCELLEVSINYNHEKKLITLGGVQ